MKINTFFTLFKIEVWTKLFMLTLVCSHFCSRLKTIAIGLQEGRWGGKQYYGVENWFFNPHPLTQKITVNPDTNCIFKLSIYLFISTMFQLFGCELFPLGRLVSAWDCLRIARRSLAALAKPFANLIYIYLYHYFVFRVTSWSVRWC